jgi:hypothetical protein
MILQNYKLVKGAQLEDFTRPFIWYFPLETDKAILSSVILETASALGAIVCLSPI